MAVSIKRKHIRIGLAVFWAIVIGWMWWNMQAHGVDADVFASDSNVEVIRSPSSMQFLPRTDTASVGLVFYPGALADPDAYAPLARGVADAGWPVVILELPFRLAPMKRHRIRLYERTLEIARANDGPKHWIVGGHSKGGKLAAEFAGDHPDAIEGLLLIGTSHPRDRDLSGLGMDVVKVFASEDGLASVEEVRRFSSNLPPETHYVKIEGGNHAGFAWYGRQIGDGSAVIPRSRQQELTRAAIIEQLQRVGRSGRND
jgi:predicted alpha/beta-hydrolase family hydrolase